MDPVTGGSPMVVVEAGRFTWCPGDRNGTREMPLAELLRLLDPATASSVDAAVADPVHSVLPGRAVVAILRDGALVTFIDREGRFVPLGPDHARVVAESSGPVSLQDLRDRTGLDVDRCASILADLVAVGVLVEDAGPVSRPDAVVDETAVPTSLDRSESGAPPVADSGRRWTGRVRKVLDTFRSSPIRVDPPSSSPSGVPDPAVDGHPGHDDVGLGSMPSRIPVHSFWATPQGPHMGVASVVAYARVHDGGRLNRTFDLRQVVPAEDVLDRISSDPGPVILLCSDYLWSIGANLDVAHEAGRRSGDLVVIHGGPSAPRQAEDCREFLSGLPDGHVVVSGEGELTFAEVLSRLAEGWRPGQPLDLAQLTGVDGVSFRHPDGRLVVNSPRSNHTQLEEFPSPLQSGEFDRVPLDVIRRVSVPVETVRGCPFGCTFCDWGQATMTRIRKFPEERIFGDLKWLADHGVAFWVIADANWGMLPRDLEVAEHIAALHRRTGFPKFVGAGPPKNSTDRYVTIIDTLLTAGVSLKAAIALQTRDQATLDAVHRSNIKTSTYDRITDEMRRRGLPLHCELMLGLPGATVDSLKADLQWCLEENVRPHIYRTFVLPNAPMNDPTYKAEHGVEVEGGMLVATNSYDRAEGELMWRIAYAYQALEFLGLARYTLRFLQWDLGLRAIDVVQRILEVTERMPDRFPLTTFVLRHFEQFIVPPVGWEPFYDELRELLTSELAVEDGSGLQTALFVDRYTMPWPARRPPYSVDLEHDYVSWFQMNNRRSRWSDDKPTSGRMPLTSFLPGRLEILADPDEVADQGFGRQVEVDSDGFPGFITAFWEVCHLELLSSLVVYEPMSHRFVVEARRLLPGRDLESSAAPPPGAPDVATRSEESQPVILRSRR